MEWREAETENRKRKRERKKRRRREVGFDLKHDDITVMLGFREEEKSERRRREKCEKESV